MITCGPGGFPGVISEFMADVFHPVLRRVATVPVAELDPQTPMTARTPMTSHMSVLSLEVVVQVATDAADGVAGFLPQFRGRPRKVTPPLSQTTKTR